MSTVREEALDAYTKWQQQQDEPDDADARALEKARRQKAKATLAASPLSSWFPSHDWDLMSYSSLGAMADYSDGTDVVVAPEDRSIYLLIQGTDGGRVYAVTHQADSATGFTYWSGPEVKSAVDVGMVLAQQEKRQ